MKRISFILLTLFLSLSVFAKQPEKGYRGFFDWSNSLENYDLTPVGRVTDYYTGFSTSHGYQITPWAFTGIGFDLEYFSTGNQFIAAPFFNFRSDFKFSIFTPFADVRIGYNCTDGGGLYFSPSVGYRFNWGRKTGINLGVGLTLKGRKTDIYDFTHGPDYGGTFGDYLGKKTNYQTFFSFRVGIDF